MRSDFEWILEDCLNRLRSGQSQEDCLAAYPEYSKELRPLLRAATHIRTVPASQPRPQAIRAGRERMLATARANSMEPSFTLPVSSSAFFRYTVRIFTFLKTLLFGKETHGMKFALRLAIDFVVILVIGSVLTVNASARSLPGDPLYSVKRTWEEVRLTLTLNDQDRQQLQEQIQQLRLDEVRDMMQMGRIGMVEFEGLLESISVNEWMVSGIQVGMQPDTIVDGIPEVGQMIRVRALVQDNGAITALQIRVQTQAQYQVPYPAPAFTHTPEPSRPTNTSWQTHEPTYEPAHTREPIHKPTYEPTHMSLPTYEPTHQTWPNDDTLYDMPATTPWPNDDCCDDDDHHNDDDRHNNSGGSSRWDGGSDSHHSWP
jgi:hypothetical protein